MLQNHTDLREAKPQDALRIIQLHQRLHQRAETYYFRGEGFFNQRKYQNAISEYNQAILIDPNYTSAYRYRGLAYDELEEYQKALADFNRVIQLEPNFTIAFHNRGMAYYALKEYQKALPDLDYVIQLAPDYATYNNRGLVHRSLKEYQKALADYNRAIELDPDHARTYNNRGQIYYELKEYQKALADYNRALELDSDYVVAYYSRGRVYHDLKEYNKALADYDRALELDPNFAQASSSREKSQEAQSTRDKDLKAFLERLREPVSSKEPKQREASIEDGSLALAQGRRQEAATAFAAIAQREPNNPQAYLGLAEANLALGDFDIVSMACHRMQELQPINGLERLLAQALLDLLAEKYDDALQAANRYTTQDVTNSYAHALRAYLMPCRIL